MQRERLPSIEYLTYSHIEVPQASRVSHLAEAAEGRYSQGAAVRQQKGDICAVGDRRDSDWAQMPEKGNQSVQHTVVCRGRCSLSFFLKNFKPRQRETEAAKLSLLAQSEAQTEMLNAQCSKKVLFLINGKCGL